MLERRGSKADTSSITQNTSSFEKARDAEPGKRLRKARKAARLSQEELAEALGVSSDSVARWEKGTSKPRPYTLRKLYEVFGKEAEMFGFEESEEQKASEVQISENEDQEISEAWNADPIPQKILPITHLNARRNVLIVGGGILALAAGYAGLTRWFRPWSWLNRSYETAQYYYKASIRCLSWSPDGAYLASAHDDRMVLIWNKQTEDSIAYKGHTKGTGYANAVAWCPTGTHIASVNGGAFPSVRVWSFPLTDTDLFVQKRSVPLTTVAWSHNGKYLAFAGRGPRIEIWEPLAKKQVSQFDLPDIMGVQDLSWSLDDRIVAVATNDKAIFFCDIDQQATRTIPDAHNGVIETIAWSPVSPTLLASGSADGRVKIWVANSNAARLTYRGHLKTVTRIDWSPDGNFIVSASTDGTVHRWEVATGNLIEKYPEKNVDDLYALDWSFKGNQLAFGGKERRIHIWNIVS